jgi:UTP--glucose-1-phosphate uridylyltransferase
MKTQIKAVIPAAGFGTRFLPLTKAQPKEMLPVINKPAIQWVVEEAVEAGITDIAIITGKHKKAIENHFSTMDKLEHSLEKTGRFKELEEIRKVSRIANLEFIIQEEPKGLGHAILCAENFVGNNPFAVLLGDTICKGKPNCTEQLVRIFNKKKRSVFAVATIREEETKRYGIVSGKDVGEGLTLVNTLVEKPEPEEAPSLSGILGRYIFTPEIFDFQRITTPSSGGEIQLTDAMQLYSQNAEIYSWTFDGKRYDIGTMKDWFQSHIELSADSEFSEILKGVIKEL